jgi:hypothetical protein
MSTPIAVNRRDAAALLGVSVDTLKAAQAEGRLRAKNTKVDAKTGRAVGVTLYALEDLRAWFEGLDDA